MSGPQRQDHTQAVRRACDVVTRAFGETAKRPEVTSFFDEPTNTVSHIVRGSASRRCGVIDSVLDYDAASGRTVTESADDLITFIRERGLEFEWILETHVHADHLSAARYIKDRRGGALGIGEKVSIVQASFGKVFNAGTEFQREGRQFDHLFTNGERFTIGELEAVALHTPGHTPDSVTYVIGDAAFVGDTLFMPDDGTARADFPGGDARTLYRSIRRVLSLPGATRWETTVAAERAHNVHIHDGVSEDEFVRVRTGRDAKLGMPKLILPSVQANMRAGEFSPAESDGQSYLKIPLNQL
jgi:glyoxylase-like metal-dependent hydrolase (beta-lactamase superfamily II)